MAATVITFDARIAALEAGAAPEEPAVVARREILRLEAAHAQERLERIRKAERERKARQRARARARSEAARAGHAA